MKPLFAFPWVVLLCASCGGGAADDRPPGEGKNLVLITLDTTRADVLGCLGGDPQTTPQLDRLAERSTLFSFATSETNVTNPSHISIMTGLPAIRHRVISNSALVLPPRLDTLPEALSREGYETGAFIAAWHLASLGWRGFDELPPVEEIIEAREVTNRALEWLRSRDGDRPFFLWVHYFDAHTPYNPPGKIARMFYDGDPTEGDGPPIAELESFHPERDKVMLEWLKDARDLEFPKAMYRACVRYADNQVGRVLATLDELGVADDTLIVVTGDHGETLDDHEPYYNHRPMYEEDLRIPLIIHLPGAPPARYDGFVNTIDILPTLRDAMGFGFERKPMGISLLSIVLGEDPPSALERRVRFVHQQAHNHSVVLREGDWKYWHPIAVRGAATPEEPLLFNLDADPGELDNRATEETTRVGEMSRLVQPWAELDKIRHGDIMDRPVEQRRMLKELGYAGSDDE